MLIRPFFLMTWIFAIGLGFALVVRYEENVFESVVSM